MSAPTVVLRCGAKGCQRVLMRIEEWPTIGDRAWFDRASGIWVESCWRHGGVPATLDELDEHRDERGLAPADRSKLMHHIRWADLHPAYEKACKRGRVVNIDVAPKSRTL